MLFHHSHGLPILSLSLIHIWTARIGNYQGFLRNGYVTAYLTYYSDKMKLEIPGPEGSYQIHIPGFEDGFSIEFVKAGQYPGIGDIPGMVIKEGVGIMATGEKTDNGLSRCV